MKRTRFFGVGVLAIMVFVASIYFQRWLESTGRSDSIGLWYTIVCAVVYTLIIYLLAGLAVFVCTTVTRRYNRKGNRNK
jgi:uncharacterized membrane protein YhaH (DUF805 family)